MRTILITLAVFVLPVVASAQRAVGEIHMRVVDESDAPVIVAVSIVGAATRVSRQFTTGPDGHAVFAALPFGTYEIVVTRSGFQPFIETVVVESVLPLERPVRLLVAGVQATVNVSTDRSITLLNPTRTGSVRYFGGEVLGLQSSATPGRSLIDLVNAQPGWLLEANGILHARGSEYQVQYVIDGIPLRDNRSPAFAQSLGVAEFDSMAIRTGGYPAEFGGKLGGVVEVNTARDIRDGLHGLANVQLGSFGTASGHAGLQFGTAAFRAGVSAEGMTTNRYLDPPTQDNFTNEGEAHGLAGRFERAWNDATRTRAYAYGRTTRFQVPNELLQQAAGQRQDRTATERLAQVSHQQVLDPSVLLNVGFMVRTTGATLQSNPFSIPIRATQDRGFTEAYVNGSLTAHRGSHELRIGGEVVTASVREAFASSVTAREFGADEVFDDVPDEFSFTAEDDLRDQAIFVQDVFRAGAATVSAGLRYDHHRLVVNEHAWSPRLSASWQVAPPLVLHGAYDRTFETQPIENILLASSNLTDELGDEAAFRPLRPSRGHFVEAGAALTGRGARLEATWFRRAASDVTDDELLFNSGVSFPIAFASARVRGLELAFDAPRWGPLSASTSYSLSKGVGRLPFTGGLFLDADDDALLEADEFELSQDQRHTLRARVRSELGDRVWLAGVFRYDSGLPVEIEGDEELDIDEMAKQYGEAIVSQVDFERARVRYGAAIDVSAGVRLLERAGRTLRLQIDVFNVFDRLNVINFAGLLSGTAVAPRRSLAVKLTADF